MSTERGKRPNFAIVVSRFNDEVTGGLLKGALKFLNEKDCAPPDANIFYAPGAFEIPLIAQKLAHTGKYCGIICLGCVIKGDTAHFEFISLATAPLARIDRAGEETKLLESSLAVLADAVEPYYGFKSLFAFKKKFQPRWDPVYLVFPGAMNLPAISYAIMRAYLPELSVGDIAKLLKDMSDQSSSSGDI